MRVRQDGRDRQAVARVPARCSTSWSSCRRAGRCGRAARRSTSYGTPLALMLIPYWTKGRITTMEGVYFEAVGHHAVPLRGGRVAGRVGENSNPVRGVPYKDQQSSTTVSARSRRSASTTSSPKPHHEGEGRRRRAGSRSSPPHPTSTAPPPEGWSIYRGRRRRARAGSLVRAGGGRGVAPDPDGWEQQIAAPWWWFPDQLESRSWPTAPRAGVGPPPPRALVTPRRSIRR